MDDLNEEKEELQDEVQEEKGELEFNKNNREYSEQLMDNASTNKDGYWDSNNVFVRLFLLGLGIIIVVGAAYYILKYMGII